MFYHIISFTSPFLFRAMATQKALVVTEIGKSLVETTFNIPEPQEHQILIKVTAAGRKYLPSSSSRQILISQVAPLDQKLRDQGLFNLGASLPAVVSLDLVGIVVKHGPNVSPSTFPIGSHVFSQGIMGAWHLGGLQEYTLIDARYAALVPSRISDTDAALFPINAATSFIALFGDSGLGIPFPPSSGFDYKSQSILIIGGGSNCGKLAIQMARIVGIGCIITTASPAREEELKRYGATHVIDRHASESEIKKQIQDLVGDELVYVYDTMTSGDHSFAASLLSNTKNGILAHLLLGKVSEDVLSRKKGGFEEKQIFGSAAAHPKLGELFWKLYPEWIESGKVEVFESKVIEGLDVKKVNEALDEYRDGTATGERWHVRVS